MTRRWSVAIVALVLAHCASPRSALGCTPVDGTVSPADAEGKFQVELRLPGQPWRDVPNPPGRQEAFCYALPGGLRITRVRTFFGVDRGHIAEARLHVVTGGQQLVTRSEHKETLGIYDAWKSQDVDYVTPGQQQLEVHAAGWSTILGQRSNMEFGVIVELQRAR